MTDPTLRERIAKNLQRRRDDLSDVLEIVASVRDEIDAVLCSELLDPTPAASPPSAEDEVAANKDGLCAHCGWPWSTPSECATGLHASAPAPSPTDEASRAEYALRLIARVRSEVPDAWQIWDWMATQFRAQAGGGPRMGEVSKSGKPEEQSVHSATVPLPSPTPDAGEGPRVERWAQVDSTGHCFAIGRLHPVETPGLRVVRLVELRPNERIVNEIEKAITVAKDADDLRAQLAALTAGGVEGVVKEWATGLGGTRHYHIETHAASLGWDLGIRVRVIPVLPPKEPRQ